MSSSKEYKKGIRARCDCSGRFSCSKDLGENLSDENLSDLTLEAPFEDSCFCFLLLFLYSAGAINLINAA